MGRDLHPNRQSIVVNARPEDFITLLESKGVYARIMQRRLCPHDNDSTRKRRLCPVCNGDGWAFEFQRKLLQTDEEPPPDGDPTLIFPYRIPVLEVVSVYSEPGMGHNYHKSYQSTGEYTRDGYIKHEITEFGPEHIRIDPPAEHWRRKKVSYYFDRFIEIQDECVDVDETTWILKTTNTREHLVTHMEIHGDIAIIDRLYNNVTGYEYKKDEYTFVKNEIYISTKAPAPVAGQIFCSYRYVPPDKVAIDIPKVQQPQEDFMTVMESGDLTATVFPWINLTQGDIITLLPSHTEKEDVITRSTYADDELPEFDVVKILSDIYWSDDFGNRQRAVPGKDFMLYRYNRIRWFGQNAPPPGTMYSVRYQHRITFQVFKEQPDINFGENKVFPTQAPLKLFNKRGMKDGERIKVVETEPDYTAQQVTVVDNSGLNITY